jgi:outer membrane protein with beta-barrel domain
MPGAAEIAETFSFSGATVAILTDAMAKTFRFTLLLLVAFALPAAAQQWSAGVGTGAFHFGDFVRRTVLPTTGNGSGSPSTLKLTGKTRPGLSVDVERRLSDRFAVRVEGAFTQARVAVRDSGGSEVGIDAGKLDVTTLMAPLVIRINPHGSLRFHVMGGPAYAMYHVRRRTAGSTQLALFEGTRNRWGLAAGIGAGWWFSNRVAVEAQVTDIDTASPFERSDFGPSALVKIPRTHNVHSTLGVRWRF